MQRHGCGSQTAFRIRATGTILLVVHLLYVGWVALRPPADPWLTASNLRPGATIRAELALGTWSAVQCLGGALLLLAPLGLLLPMAAARPAQGSLAASFARTVFAAVMASLGLSLLQTNLWGRTLDVDFLLLHTAGVACTHLLLVPPLRAWLRRRSRTSSRRVSSQGAPPTIPRVGTVP